MNLIRIFIVALISLLAAGSLNAQKITYSEPEREDNRRTNFDIIGRVGQNILVFKNNRADYDISVYDNDMKLKQRVNLDGSDDRWINVDFIPYPDHVWMIYQYQRRNIVYCMGVKLDENAKPLADPIEIDTSRISWTTDNKIYNTIFSDDKERIMVFKINNRNRNNFLFTTMLFDASLNLQAKHNMTIPMEERNDYFTDFLLDNEGGMVFGKYTRKGNDYITNLQVVTKATYARDFSILDLETGDRILDEVRVKVDNINKRYLFSAFFYKQRRGNIEGLYTVVYDKNTASVAKKVSATFSDELRAQAKGPDANLKLAFNDFFIRNMIMRRDGGFLLIAESMYTTSRGSAFNRWNYMGWNNPWMNPMNYYYSPFYSPWNSPWNRYGSGQATRYHAENILVISFDGNGNIEWSNVIPKSQFDDEGDALISHYIMNTGSELHFLFNQYERRTLLLSDQSIGPDGKITRYPTLKNLDRGYEFMPRFGKQIAARTVVMPTLYRNYITFAKIDF